MPSLQLLSKKNSKKITATIINGLFSLFKGIIPLILIPLFLTEVEQGYWYTFVSLGALVNLADLGFMTIVTQYSSHEYAHLEIEKGVFVGEERFLDRISSLYKFICKWMGAIIGIAYPVIAGIGIGVLSTNGILQVWIFPWLIYVFGSLFYLFITSMFSFLEGCNQMAVIQIFRLIGSIVSVGFTALFLYLHLNIFTLGLAISIVSVVSFAILFAKYHRIIFQLFKYKNKEKVAWRKDFLNLIWRYAISWGAGYLMYQIYTPIAYMMFDPSVAGKVGITITLIQSCSYVAASWNTIFTPTMNVHCEKQEWGQMDSLLKRMLILNVSSCILGYTAVVVAFHFLRERFDIFDRFLGTIPMIVLAISFTLQLIVATLCIYGRSHKIEPFIIPSVVSAIIISISTFLFGKFLPIDYYFLGYLIGEFICMVVTIIMYFKLKNRWHEIMVRKLSDAK